MSFFISVGGVLSYFSACIECSCMALLTPTMMVIRGLNI